MNIRWCQLIKIGRGTYGEPIIPPYPHHDVTIGNFCSIAGNVTILSGGEHDVSRITTYPILDRMFEQTEHKAVRPVVIGHDVWIGWGAIICDGVQIGNGAVIGAGAVVRKRVFPYSIVAGNPAQHLRFRFTPDQIAFLEELKWWDWPDEQIRFWRDVLLSNDVDRLRREHEAGKL